MGSYLITHFVVYDYFWHFVHGRFFSIIRINKILKVQIIIICVLPLMLFVSTYLIIY